MDTNKYGKFNKRIDLEAEVIGIHLDDCNLSAAEIAEMLEVSDESIITSILTDYRKKLHAKDIIQKHYNEGLDFKQLGEKYNLHVNSIKAIIKNYKVPKHDFDPVKVINLHFKDGLDIEVICGQLGCGYNQIQSVIDSELRLIELHDRGWSTSNNNTGAQVWSSRIGPQSALLWLILDDSADKSKRTLYAFEGSLRGPKEVVLENATEAECKHQAKTFVDWMVRFSRDQNGY